jgi:uncharacterized membrane protein
MTRSLLYLLGGVLLGLLIHIVVILTLPGFASRDVFTRIEAMDTLDTVTVLPAVAAGEPNPLQLDPSLVYAVCRLDLASGAGVVSGVLPDAFWSVAVYDRRGIVTYSTANRDGIGRRLELGVFNPEQTRRLAQQEIDIAEGLLIVEAPSDDIFVVVRLAPPHQAMRDRFATALTGLTCGTIE